MGTVHTIVQGEHLSQLAEDAGFRTFKTIWEDGDNAELAATRDPHVLFPGDQLTIPDFDIKDVNSRNIDQSHKFVALGQPLFLKLKLLDIDGRPLIGASCEVDVDVAADPDTVTADGEGKIEDKIPRKTKTGEVKATPIGDTPPPLADPKTGADVAPSTAGDGKSDPDNPDDAVKAGGDGAGEPDPNDPKTPDDSPDPLKYDLRIGHLNPKHKMSGQQARLNNMGYFAGYTLKDLDQFLWAVEEFECEAKSGKIAGPSTKVTARPTLLPPPATGEDDGKADPDAPTGVQEGDLVTLIETRHGI